MAQALLTYISGKRKTGLKGKPDGTLNQKPKKGGEEP